MKYKRSIWIPVLLMLSLLYSKDSVADIRVHYAPTAYIGQEIYNWIDVLNEPAPVKRIEYYRDGSLMQTYLDINNRRFNIKEQLSTTGVHFFRIKQILSDGTEKTVNWMTSVVPPTKNMYNAVGYAEYYAIIPNLLAYGFFPADCTNFVSQILHEGGEFPMESGNADPTHNWYFSYLGYSNTWTVVEDFYKYTDYKGITYVDSPLSSPIYIGQYKTYDFPPLLNAGLIEYYFPWGDLHNAFIVGRGTDSQDQSLFDGPQPLVNYHTENKWHINWTLASRNKDWQDTLLKIHAVKWDY